MILLKLYRIQHYIKNLLVFAPLFFSLQFTFQDLTDVALSFILFSALASSIYIFNDLVDINLDKNHPKKKFRPIASGKISKSTAKIHFIILSLLSLGISFITNYNLFLILLTYFAINIFYSTILKNFSIIDIFLVASGFVIRLLAGSVIIDIYLSPWIVIITFLSALFLALGKRKDDVLHEKKGKKVRMNIKGYNNEFINFSLIMLSSSIIVTYILYTINSETVSHLKTDYLYITSLFVILGLLRYLQIMFVEKKSGDPMLLILSDKFLQYYILGWVISFILLVKIL